ncbi:cytochrome P450 [Pleurotus eryngii]|uniref:Cytochrome P450 n=1 Tax=Pleurotus eryngii TaxID=5323 RepID=A0A9P6DB70_PLEER|nr:cytochrome P450 [Pleurotus eryngii]
MIHRGDGLASVKGDQHRKLKRLLSPLFTASNVSKLEAIFYHVAYRLRETVAEEVVGFSSRDIFGMLSSTALELIVKGGISYPLDCLAAGDAKFSDFQRALNTVLPTAGRLWMVIPYFESWRKLRPVWLRRFLSRLVLYLPWKAAREFKQCCDLMDQTCRDMYGYQQNLSLKKLGRISGRDLCTHLLEAKESIDCKHVLTNDDIVANMSSIILAGHETTTSAMSRLLHILAARPELQERVREEIVSARTNNDGKDLNYRQLDNLPLLDAVCRETLRLFPPVIFVGRETAQDTIVPLKFPIHDMAIGSQELRILKGTRVYVGIGAINRSEELWGTSANQFIPERWFNREDRTQHAFKMPGVYSDSLTFLGGARSCLGMKFALFEIKLLTSVLLGRFALGLSDKEICWRLDTTVLPYVEGETHKGPSLPLIVKDLQVGDLGEDHKRESFTK